MEFKNLPDFANHKINENGSKIFKIENDNLIEIVIKNDIVRLKNDKNNKKENYKIRDLVALAFLKYPLDSGIVSYKNGTDNHYTNLKWTKVDKDYKDIDFLTEKNIEIFNLPRYILHSLTSDGHIINRTTSHVMTEDYSQKDGKGRVRLPLGKGKGKQRAKFETVVIEDLISAVFIKKPTDATVLIRKNGLEMDNSRENFVWELSGNATLSFIRENKKFLEVYKPVEEKQDSVTEEAPDDEDDFFQKNRDLEENRDNIFYGNESFEENYFSDSCESEDAEDVCNEEEEKEYENILPPHHDPIYEEFEISDVEYDLNNAVNMEGKLWLPAKYKSEKLDGYMISENFDLFSKRLGRIITDNDSEMTVNFKGGGCTRKYKFRKYGTIDLKDIAASSFLKVPEKAFTSVYRKWNKDNSEGKYSNQTNHYTNIRWLTEDDLTIIGERKEGIFLSKQGDFYSTRRGSVKLLKEMPANSKELRRVKIVLKVGSKKGNVKIYQSHIEIALAFVKRPDKSYRYVLFKNGNTFDVHYRNLIWVKTLSGYHGDKVKYFEVPNYPEYLVSETNVPYSFKRGVLKQMKLSTNLAGYNFISMLNKIKERKSLLYHRVVSSARKKDYKDNIWIDHIDGNRKNNHPDNLRNATPKENALNYIPYRRGKEISQINIDDGSVIATFGNSKMAVEKLGETFNKSFINDCANKNSKIEGKNFNNNIIEEYKTYNGFIWKYLIKKEKYVCKDGEIFYILVGNFQGLGLEYDNYTISNYGTIVNMKTGFAKCFTSDGYPTVKLSKNGKSTGFFVHVLVGHVFVPGKTSEKYRLNHLDERIFNYKAENLDWVTNSENGKYSAYKRGKPVKKICMETNKLLAVYNSREEGAVSCGKPNHGWCITKACSGEFSHAYGFYWKDIEAEEISSYPDLEINKRKIKFPKID